MAASRLCVLTTHPIQYIAPWFRELAGEPGIDLDVLFLREPNPQQQGAGFGTAFTWDVPLREGYRSTVLGIAQGWPGVPRLWQRLAGHWDISPPEAVMITGWNEPALAAAYLLARARRLPVIVRGEANMLRRRPGRKRALHRALLRMAWGALAIGQGNRDFYLANGMPPERVFPGAYFVETQRMLQMAAEHGPARHELRRACGHGPDDFVFAFVGKHVPFKRPLLLVEAAALLRRQGLPVRLHMAGSGELTDALAARARELQVPAHFTGFLNQSELWRAYVPADALVLPSDNGETWGLVVNEAMLFGLPAITSVQVGCSRDLVREAQTGFVFDGGAPELAAAMARLADHPAQAREMGRRGRALVASEYSMPVATAGLKAALEALRAPAQGASSARSA